MSRTRKRVAAAQALLSVVLLVVVYLTLLRPDSGGEMLAVDARQGQELDADGVFASRGERDANTQGDDPAAGAPARGAAGAIAGGLTDTAARKGVDTTGQGGPVGSPEQNPADPPPGDGDEDGDEDDSPTDHQYGDVVSQLLGRVGAPD